MGKARIRVNDRVRIAIPRFVARVGYPKCVGDYLEQVDKEAAAIDNLINRILYGGHEPLLGIPQRSEHSALAMERIRNALAYLLAKQDRFGGRERAIHYIELPQLAGAETHVTNLRTVVTGVYQPAGGGSSNWYGEDDYYPPYLDDQKYHRVAQLDISGFLDDSGKFTSGLEAPIEHLELTEGGINDSASS